MISIPTLRAQSREEYVVAVSVASPESTVTLHAGRRKLTLSLLILRITMVNVVVEAINYRVVYNVSIGSK